MEYKYMQNIYEFVSTDYNLPTTREPSYTQSIL